MDAIDFTRTANDSIVVTSNGNVATFSALQDVKIRKMPGTTDKMVVKTRDEQLKYVFLLSILSINGVAFTGTNADNAAKKLQNDVFGTGDGTALGKFSQVITFPAPANHAHTDPAFSAGASVDSGLPLSYVSSDPTKATVGASTGIITPVAAGSTNITVSQAGDAFYNAATNVVRALTIT